MLLDKLNIILNSSDEFSPKYIISSFVKNNLNDIPTMSIDAIALSCHTSKSQISKYVKSLGYETMKDFKEDCLIIFLVWKELIKFSFHYKTV